ncbi:M20/M25/M40 family metallo-hydrolase [Nocardia anaemiae]|uniref:M20/M25/M40 family metallo-hydrolase n=1 Tax=Nocardia anaemiae TaxID=263910 RepID=UPI001471354F|nr:M20/M25/M40 family metallo-hydrolase [Nocardia anaemiae]
MAGELVAAQQRYADAACLLGFDITYHAAVSQQELTTLTVPKAVFDRAAAMDADFLAAQPNLVLSLGDAPHERTLVFNFHMDTVSPYLPVREKSDVVFGRGAVDDKGPGVALLAGIRAALQRDNSLPGRVRILIHVVGGEEGGAMGVYGTRTLVAMGLVGRLNVVVEPTMQRYFDRATATMTLRLTATGRGGTDDEPNAAQNATLLLGFLAAWFGKRVLPVVDDAGARSCLAGLHTGTAHNRVYGRGSLLLNFAYPNKKTAAIIERTVDCELSAALTEFAAVYGGHPTTAETAAAADTIVRGEWLKRGLPTLDNRDPAMERLLRAAGFARHDDATRPITCDAIWLTDSDSYTIVCGPGDLTANNAHAEDEYVAVADLDAFAERVAALVMQFAGAGTNE